MYFRDGKKAARRKAETQELLRGEDRADAVGGAARITVAGAAVGHSSAERKEAGSGGVLDLEFVEISVDEQLGSSGNVNEQAGRYRAGIERDVNGEWAEDATDEAGLCRVKAKRGVRASAVATSGDGK